MVNDPIGDMLIQIKNAAMVGKRVVDLPYSRIKYELASILAKEGYVDSVEKMGSEPKLMLRIINRFQGKAPVINGIKRISKPGLRWYVRKTMIPTVVGGVGVAILSTPQGLMTNKEAKKQGTGGEVLCEVW